MRYGQSIFWTDFNGNTSKVEVGDCATQDEATNAAIESATAFGWTYPKWWQWWRRYDTRPSLPGAGEHGS